MKLMIYNTFSLDQPLDERKDKNANRSFLFKREPESKYLSGQQL